MASVLTMLGFLVAGVLLTALGAWLMVRRWPLGVEDLLGYFGLLAPDESMVANPEGPETPASRQRRRSRRRHETDVDPTAAEPEGPRRRRH